jgi:hypothetical protein
MAVETNPSSPSEMSRPALRLPVRQQQRRGAASCEPEKPSPLMTKIWSSWPVRRRQHGLGSSQASNRVQSSIDLGAAEPPVRLLRR